MSLVVTASVMPPAGSSPGSWKSEMETSVNELIPGSVRSLENAKLFAVEMKPKATALTCSDLRRQVKASCVMRSERVSRCTAGREELTLGEAGESRLVGDVEHRLLLDAAVARRDADRREEELAQLDLVRQVLGRNPVHDDRVGKVEVRREDADLPDLTFEREREGRVGRGSDVGRGDVEDSDAERVLGNRVENGVDSDEDGDLRACASERKASERNLTIKVRRVTMGHKILHLRER